MPVQELSASQVIPIRLHVLSRHPADDRLLLRQQLDPQLVNNRMSDLVLNGKDVGEITVVAVGPDVTAISAVDELRGDAHTRADLPNTSFQDEGDPEILAHLLRF